MSQANGVEVNFDDKTREKGFPVKGISYAIT